MPLQVLEEPQGPRWVPALLGGADQGRVDDDVGLDAFKGIGLGDDPEQNAL